MSSSYDLTKLDSDTFEHMVNALALAVIGAGATGFGPGSDGGRDGFFEGDAPYPSVSDRWSGIWYIQSKFHKPHLSHDPQKWLLEKINEELHEFSKDDSKRTWPTNWIIATNIDATGAPETGAFDRARAIVKAARPELEKRFHIWGGAKIIEFLAANQHVAERYGHFLTPGHLLAEMMAQLKDDRANVDLILQQLIVRKFKDQKLTKLEQAGSQSDVKPAIHDLFVDLPFLSREHRLEADVMNCFTSAGNEVHQLIVGKQEGAAWRFWAKHPRRARVWFLRGGPGQGKSTAGQYYCQIQRAALILGDADQINRILKAQNTEYETAREVRLAAERNGFWPLVPRIPLHIELKDYAQWYGKKKKSNTPKGVLTYVAEELGIAIEQPVKVGTLKRALKGRRWVAIFDGLDEVPEDVKDNVANEVKLFITQIALEESCDLLSLCTSRPQGYSGQFRDLDCATVDMLPLPTDRALACARPVISFQRSKEDSRRAIELLESSAHSPSIRELLTTPLQAHILAVVVRDGERPPDRRWKLYSRFYDVIRRREANRNLPDVRLARLLGNEEKLLKALHNRVGFRLQADAETSEGAETSLAREDFRVLASKTVSQMIEDNVEQKVEVLDKATTERLVLINTPEHGTKLRFDIRQLQEFFAAECLYDSVNAEELRSRIAIVAGDAHWREVTHFLLSSLVENDRSTELSVAIDQLRRLNDGDKDEFGILSRRAGKGAMLAARLLSEGVLEQDKTVRQSFRDCLTPMAAFANIGRLSTFLNVSQENSSAWLFSFLLDKLRESAPAENIGAAIILAHRLPDAHPRLSEVRQFLSRSSASYLGAVVDSFSRRGYEHDRNEAPNWFVVLLMERLTQPNWTELGSETISSILWLLRQKSAKQLSATVVEPQFTALLPLLWLSLHESAREDRVVIGNFHFIVPGSAYNAEELISAVNEEALGEDAHGILNAVQHLLRFFKLPNRESYVAVLRVIQQAGLNLLLPLRRAIRFPMPKLSSETTLASKLDQINGMTDAEFTAWLNAGENVQTETHVAWEFGFQQDRQASSLDLIECYRYSPELALQLVAIICSHKSDPFETPETLNAFVKEILPSLRTDPAPILSVPSCWYPLIKSGAAHTDELRKVICDACRTSLPYAGTQKRTPLFHRYGNFANIGDVLKLFNEYGEPSLLPHIAELVLGHMRMYGVGRNVASEAVLPATLMSVLTAAAQSLGAVATNERLCWSVRCSAALLQVLSLGADPNADVLRPVASAL